MNQNLNLNVQEHKSQLGQLSWMSLKDALNQNALNVLASNLSKRQRQIKELEQKLNQVGLTDRFSFKKLKDQIFNAQVVAPNGEIIPDFLEMLKAIKIRKLLRWYTKKWLSLEELLGFKDDESYKLKIHNILDEIWLDDQSVFKQLKYIMENAYYIVPTWRWKDLTYVKTPYNKVINMAIREYSLLKDYIEDDTFNALNLLKVDEKKLQIIFGDNWLDE